MMKKVQLIVMAAVIMCIAAGCTNYEKEYSRNTLVVKSNGSLVEVAIENFNDSPVQADELVSYVEEQITDYNEEVGKKYVKQLSINTEDMSQVELVLKYKNIDSYNGFNSLECILADFSEVKESALEGTFKSVEGKTVKSSDLTDTDRATVMILSEKTDVIFDGELLYHNDEVQVEDGVVTTSGNGNAIIIFK
ncbi:MAG: hypothetical protein NC124_00280 [Clostridium sp.]|nr:hypothetical protein [Clostridium sp.]